MQKPLAIANWFIIKGMETNTQITQMKLQKLIYFAHGWNLALYNEPLISDSFQAWKYGPVVPSVYFEFRGRGTASITSLGMDWIAQGEELKIEPVLLAEEDGKNSLLNRIWEVYGKYSGTQLSEMTHAEDTPWTRVRENFPEDTYNIPIPNDLIKHYFKSKLN